MPESLSLECSQGIINNQDTSMRTATQEKQSCVVGIRLTPYLKEGHEMMTPEEFLEWKRINEDFFCEIHRRHLETKLAAERNIQKHTEAEILANYYRDNS